MPTPTSTHSPLNCILIHYHVVINQRKLALTMPASRRDKSKSRIPVADIIPTMWFIRALVSCSILSQLYIPTTDDRHNRLLYRLRMHAGIGANCPRTPGTVPDLEALSCVPLGNHNLPGLSQIFKDPQISLGCQASWKVIWL